jgi:hypothetical protein
MCTNRILVLRWLCRVSNRGGNKDPGDKGGSEENWTVYETKKTTAELNREWH